MTRNTELEDTDEKTGIEISKRVRQLIKDAGVKLSVDRGRTIGQYDTVLTELCMEYDRAHGWVGLKKQSPPQQHSKH